MLAIDVDKGFGNISSHAVNKIPPRRFLYILIRQQDVIPMNDEQLISSKREDDNEKMRSSTEIWSYSSLECCL
jgi:hypothetical protein